MQLRMLARRSTGPFTVLGDIAQAAGPIAYRSWDDLLPYLGAEAQIEELRLAYRVPRDVLELALPLLPLIAPDVAAPIAYREGDEPPRFVHAEPEHLVAAAVREAGHEALREGRTALIAPATLIAELEPLLPGPGTAFDELAAPIQALTPRAAKGLEFDRVVLVEPARIVSEADRIEGLRALYVALTRATKTLVVVHAEPLPVELGLRAEGRSTRYSSSPRSCPMPSIRSKRAIMNAEQRPGSSTSLRRIRPSRSNVSQQPRMFSTSTQLDSASDSRRMRRPGS